jgi:hypothetical protein
MSSTPALPSRLSQRFAELAVSTGETRVTFGDLLTRLRERGHALMALVLVLPFLQPVPLPLLSTAMGLAVAVLGVQMALGRPPWLPARLARRGLSADQIGRIARTGQRIFARFEHLVRPRIHFFHAHPGMRRVSGVVIAVAGLLLSLPLPIPASNLLPAMAVALLAMGSLEEDGLMIILGFLAFGVALSFFVAIGALPWLGVQEALARR